MSSVELLHTENILMNQKNENSSSNNNGSHLNWLPSTIINTSTNAPNTRFLGSTKSPPSAHGTPNAGPYSYSKGGIQRLLHSPLLNDTNANTATSPTGQNSHNSTPNGNTQHMLPSLLQKNGDSMTIKQFDLPPTSLPMTSFTGNNNTAQNEKNNNNINNIKNNNNNNNNTGSAMMPSTNSQRIKLDNPLEQQHSFQQYQQQQHSQVLNRQSHPQLHFLNHPHNNMNSINNNTSHMLSRPLLMNPALTPQTLQTNSILNHPIISSPPMATSNDSYHHNNTNNNHSTNNLNINTRKNTQEAIAKSIAERYKDKPISDYIPIVKNAEMDCLHLNPNLHSKTTVQQAEQNRKRERQVYAFIWLMQNCISDSTSFVPRGRIFSQYASSCAKNSLKPLSQASLGKLIRSVFPNLKTRRLGMRGQSKYHYCGLRLLNDNENITLNNSGSESVLSDGGRNSVDALNLEANNNNPQIVETKAYSEDISSTENISSNDDGDNDSMSVISSTATIENLVTTTCAKAHSNSSDVTILNSLYSENQLPLLKDFHHVVFNNIIINSNDFFLKFPQIPTEKLPSGIDRDIVSSLESLYYVHCNTLYQNICFLKFDEIPNCLSIFGSGGISPQMYDLFISEQLSNWISECDMITHVALVKFLSNMIINQKENKDGAKLTDTSLTRLELFAEEYQTLLSNSITDLPKLTGNKKIEVSKMFSRLLKKLILLVGVSKKFSRAVSKMSTENVNDEKLIDKINLDEILEIVDVSIPGDKKLLIKEFVRNEISFFVNEVAIPNKDQGTLLSNMVESYCNFFSIFGKTPALRIMCNALRVSDALISEILVKSTEDNLPWLLYNNLSHHLFFYLIEANTFLSSKTILF